MSVRTLALSGARVIVGGTFIIASLDKIARPELFMKIVQNYRILPQEVVPLFSFVLPWVELVLGIFLLVGLFIRGSAMVAAFLLALFISAIFIKAAQGSISECGCFSVTPGNAKLSASILLFRDFALLALCLTNIFSSSIPISREVIKDGQE
ncbi:MAG: DoxX family membrane protein [Methanosarcinaceae archaeon]|nr:DoxX family membrane protein [Methanosarcinaceae archaeon]